MSGFQGRDIAWDFKFVAIMVKRLSEIHELRWIWLFWQENHRNQQIKSSYVNQVQPQKLSHFQNPN